MDQRDRMDLIGGDRNIVGPQYQYHPATVENPTIVSISHCIEAIEGNIKDNKEIIERQKEHVYRAASNYEYIRDHGLEIDRIKADVREREIMLKAYEHCLRILKGEQRY